MKKLAVSADTRNRDLRIYEDSNFVNYYSSPVASDVKEIPEGAGYIQIVSDDAGVWYKIGRDQLVMEVPSSNVDDGSSPSYLAAGDRIIHRIVAETQISLQSDGDVVVSYWSQ